MGERRKQAGPKPAQVDQKRETGVVILIPRHLQAFRMVQGIEADGPARHH